MTALRLLVVLGLMASLAPAPLAASKHKKKAAKADAASKMLWHDPGDVKSRNLLYGPGGQQNQPQGPMKFKAEDMAGTNPKFSVEDGGGRTWKVKLGVEAKPETAVVRLLWAVGYFADDDYFVPELKVDDMQPLKRGNNLVHNGTVNNVRLKYVPGKKEGTWEWRENPFSGTRELNGLRVMMALVNNWDVKDENNAIYLEKGEEEKNSADTGAVAPSDDAAQGKNKKGKKGKKDKPEEGQPGPRQKDAAKAENAIYLASDVGASFGYTGYHITGSRSKGIPPVYARSRFITKVTANTVNFATPSRPALIDLFSFWRFCSRMHLRWVGRDIPRADAKWIGSLLAQLTPQQIRDAFRAAGYSDADVESLAQTVEKRIAALNAL